MNLIPAYFAQKMHTIYGAEGAAWIQALPERLAYYAKKWAFTLHQAVEHLSYNYVAYVTRQDGRPAVFKIGYPNREIFTEIDTLEIYQGKGMVPLIMADRSQAAFLMAQISPGKALSKLADDDEATRIMAQIMSRLRRPVPDQHHFPHLQTWAQALVRYQEAFAHQAGPLPMRLVDRAVRLFETVRGSSAEALLHGDLHHFNVLQAGETEWVAIDPKGVIGDCVFECARFLHNPYPKILHHAALEKMIDRRVAIICELLGYDREQVLAWGFCDTMLSLTWSVEDHELDGLDLMLNFAEVIGRMG